jgi:hypothetical protein
LCGCSTATMALQPPVHSAMPRTLECIIGASGVLLAASEPDPSASMDQSQGGMDWRFWMVLASLVVMTGRQLTQDVLALCAWTFPASPATPEAVPGVATPDEPAASITVEPTTTIGSPMSGPVEPDVASSSSGAVPRPTVPIWISRYGEKYHYRRECSGLRMANPMGIESKTLCRTCDHERRR